MELWLVSHLDLGYQHGTRELARGLETHCRFIIDNTILILHMKQSSVSSYILGYCERSVFSCALPKNTNLLFCLHLQNMLVILLMYLTLLHSEGPKLYTVLAFCSNRVKY